MITRRKQVAWGHHGQVGPDSARSAPRSVGGAGSKATSPASSSVWEDLRREARPPKARLNHAPVPLLATRGGSERGTVQPGLALHAVCRNRVAFAGRRGRRVGQHVRHNAALLGRP
jgi:hypothetical protein